MPLTLKITSKQRHILGADSMRVFSVHGGSIGRAPDNDWVLPDPDRYISGHHAAIDYRAGNYYLRDNSTNGVFVNHSSEPVGRGTPIRLYDGDELRMGDYVFEVSVVNVSPDGSDDSGQGPDDARPERRLKRRQPAAPLSLKLLGDEADQLHVAAQEMMAGRKAPPPDEEPVIQIDEREFGNTVVASGSGIELSPDEAVPKLPGGDFRPAAQKKAFTATDGQDFSAAVRLLMESAGLDPRRLPHGDEQQTMVTVGRFIRATVAGLQSALQTRTLIKTQFQLDLTGMQPVNNNPLKFIPDTQEALEQLFYREAEGYLGLEEAVGNAVEDLRTHQSAMVRAMQAAFRDLLERLSPEHLEEKFEGKGKRGTLLGLSGKSNHWELYREAYEQLTGLSDDILLKMVAARFAEAYTAELQNLKGRKGAKVRPS
ncbi:MAG: type VI secretion system-associated FHA domain protein TagH [Gammaproteobacteria bacterium]